MRINGKIALVTGGAQRVGKAIALALAGAGANLIINYHRSEEAAEDTAQQARAMGIEAWPVQADISDLQQVQAMLDMAATRLGPIDILVNSASSFEQTPFPMKDVAGWHRITNILIHGPFYCANAVAPGMLERGEGTIINVVDLSAWEPWPNFAAHSVGKAGLLALTRQLAVELAPAIRVNAVAPGPVLPQDHYTETMRTRSAQRTLLKRWGRPEDVAETVLFLIKSDYITGETIVVDGGQKFGRPKPQE